MKPLRLAAVSTIEAGDAFPPRFVENFNERFYGRADDLHRKLGSLLAGLATSCATASSATSVRS